MEPTIYTTIDKIIEIESKKAFSSPDATPQFLEIIARTGKLAEGIKNTELETPFATQGKIESAVGKILYAFITFGISLSCIYYPDDIKKQKKYAQDFIGHCLYETWQVTDIKSGWTNNNQNEKRDRMIP